MGHRIVLLNEEGFERTKESIPDYVNIINEADQNLVGVENAGERGLLGTRKADYWADIMFPAEGVVEAYREAFVEGLQSWVESGMTSFASRLSKPQYVEAFQQIMDEHGRLPLRFAFSMEMQRAFIPPDFSPNLYATTGPLWTPMDRWGPWFWPHSISSEGAGDSVQGACITADLEPVREDVPEECPTLEQTGFQLMKRSLQAGWRVAGVHGVGTDGIRRFVNMVEAAIEDEPALTREDIRNRKLGLAHGTMAGIHNTPDVLEDVVDLEILVPINIIRTLTEEAQVTDDFYGEKGREFLGPVKSLLDEGVKVVGESENAEPGPGWYFEVIHAFVNRSTVGREGGEETDVIQPDEGVDRVTALKLITTWSAEFLRGKNLIGSLERGKLADFVVIENDVLEAPEDQLRDNKVIAVGIDGEIEHQTDEAEGAISINRPREC